MICITDPHLLAYAQEHFPEILKGRFTIGCVSLDLTKVPIEECSRIIEYHRCSCDNRKWAMLSCLVSLQYAKDFPNDPSVRESRGKAPKKSALN